MPTRPPLPLLASVAFATLTISTAVISTAAISTPARAADLDDTYGDAPPVPVVGRLTESKVEFGSGWYVRGDLGAVKLPSLSIGTPANLPTATNFSRPDTPVAGFTNGSNIGYVASLGAGYSFTHWFRGDIVADFHQPIRGASNTGGVYCPTGISYPNETTDPNTGKITYGSPSYAYGGCTGSNQARLQSYDVLVNGYLDLGRYSVVTPYVGVGVGLSFGHYQISSTYTQANGQPYQATIVDPQYGTFYYNYDRSSSGTYYQFAYALMAGFAVDVYDHTKLDIGYRYLNLGRPTASSGSLYQHELRAGLRYMIDN